MEVRMPAFAGGTRVLVVDQRVETGGTMDGAIRLVKRQRGTVAGIVAIAMEENERTADYRKSYPVTTAVLPGSIWQSQCNRQRLESFAVYSAERTFPTAGRSMAPTEGQTFVE